MLAITLKNLFHRFLFSFFFICSHWSELKWMHIFNLLPIKTCTQCYIEHAQMHFERVSGVRCQFSFSIVAVDHKLHISVTKNNNNCVKISLGKSWQKWNEPHKHDHLHIVNSSVIYLRVQLQLHTYLYIWYIFHKYRCRTPTENLQQDTTHHHSTKPYSEVLKRMKMKIK